MIETHQVKDRRVEVRHVTGLFHCFESELVGCADGLAPSDPCTGQPLEMLFPEIGIHDVERSLSAVNAVLDERAKDPVLLLDAVEESANVTLPPENAPGELHETVVGLHRLPHRASVVQSDVSCRSVPRAADR